MLSADAAKAEAAPAVAAEPARDAPGAAGVLAPAARLLAGVSLSADCVLALQQTAGNRAVCRYFERARPVLARTPTPTAAASAATPDVAFVREDQLNLRARPDQASHSLTRMAFGTRVHVLEPRHGDWLKVAEPAGSGYAFAPSIHYPPGELIQQDPALKMIRVKQGETFWGLVAEQYGIRGNEGSADQNVDHFINAIRKFNKPEAFDVDAGAIDHIVPGRDASDTKLKAGYDLWIPSYGVAARMDVGSGTVSGEITRIIHKVEQKVTDFRTACSLAGKHIPKAVAEHAGDAGAGLLHGLVDFALDAVKILAVSTAAGALIGALFGGVGAAPGAEIGFEIGLLILEAYGLTMLIEAILDAAGDMVSQLGTFLHLVWHANGDRKQLDAAGQALADALGILVAAILTAAAAYVLHRGFEAIADTKFGKTVGKSDLKKWFDERQRQQTTRDTVAERRKRAREQRMRREREARRRAQRLEQLYKEAKNPVSDLPEADRAWVEADARHKEALLRPGQAGLGPGVGPGGQGDARGREQAAGGRPRATQPRQRGARLLRRQGQGRRPLRPARHQPGPRRHLAVQQADQAELRRLPRRLAHHRQPGGRHHRIGAPAAHAQRRARLQDHARDLRARARRTLQAVIEDLPARLERHRTWLDTGGAQGERLVALRAKLSDLDLSGARLARADLRCCELTGVSLAGADLHGANLQEIVLHNVDARNADFRDADLIGAYISDSDLTGARLDGADLSKAELFADLSGASLRGARLVRVEGSETSLAGADLTGADLDATLLVDFDLRGANLTGATLRAGNLSGARIANLTGRPDAVEGLVAEWVDTSPDGDGSGRSGPEALWQALGIS